MGEGGGGWVLLIESKRLYGKDPYLFSSISDEEDEHDFSQGAELFLQLVRERREKRKEALETESDVSSYIGIESRLIGCATWEKSHV